jgi:RNA 2',3'-cyclic 3'-phosphodiesterase
VRLFIAIPLPPDVASRAANVLPAALPALRRVPPENLHVTLAFLGHTDDARLDDVAAAARSAARPVRAFRLELGGAGRFPATGRPRVVWLGITRGAESVHELGERVTEELRSRSLRFDDRPLSPHLTLARVVEGARAADARTVAAALPDLDVPHLGFDVASIAVMQSVLSPKGARYTVRSALDLGTA